MTTSIKGLIGLAFMAAVGLTFLLLACCASSAYNWWPMFVLLFYILSPMPVAIGRRYTDSVESSNVLKEVCWFFTAGFVVSAYALPFVLAHALTTDGGNEHVILWSQAALTWTGNCVVFLSILFYFVYFTDGEDGDTWGVL